MCLVMSILCDIGRTEIYGRLHTTAVASKRAEGVTPVRPAVLEQDHVY